MFYSKHDIKKTEQCKLNDFDHLYRLIWKCAAR